MWRNLRATIIINHAQLTNYEEEMTRGLFRGTKFFSGIKSKT